MDEADEDSLEAVDGCLRGVPPSRMINARRWMLYTVDRCFARKSGGQSVPREAYRSSHVQRAFLLASVCAVAGLNVEVLDDDIGLLKTSATFALRMMARHISRSTQRHSSRSWLNTALFTDEFEGFAVAPSSFRRVARRGNA